MANENGGELWVFGYGSLMWRPGFDYVERVQARLDGYARRFCLRSIAYRGTPEKPGLVLGLDPENGAATEGVAFRVAPDRAEPCRAYLRERELVTYAYTEIETAIALHDGRRVTATTFVIDPHHEQYAGHMSIEAQAEIIATAVGPMGPNAEYLDNTLAHLAELSLPDPELEAVAAAVRARMAG